MSFTKNPMKPMMQKPTAVATAIFWNSEGKKKFDKEGYNFNQPVKSLNETYRHTSSVRLCTLLHKAD